jgi:hypothetical protein
MAFASGVAAYSAKIRFIERCTAVQQVVLRVVYQIVFYGATSRIEHPYPGNFRDKLSQIFTMTNKIKGK